MHLVVSTLLTLACSRLVNSFFLPAPLLNHFYMMKNRGYDPVVGQDGSGVLKVDGRPYLQPNLNCDNCFTQAREDTGEEDDYELDSLPTIKQKRDLKQDEEMMLKRFYEDYHGMNGYIRATRSSRPTRALNQLRLGKRTLSQLRIGKRNLKKLRLGKRSLSQLRIGKRSMDTTEDDM
ncbi:myomodulin neuropeptides [Eurytemora carolleeae]|uniref:myomodulin neuropeptides n=1 Tax=Eurytemora carolleeae TaxID=1294199 RepID=UPI000C793740|nr:myomodulin neuropeptides [Eurytemora carolleeae]|eukprot:XP_023319834.1 myomodulin neuropeptides-like [Eurytemora affinis]